MSRRLVSLPERWEWEKMWTGKGLSMSVVMWSTLWIVGAITLTTAAARAGEAVVVGNDDEMIAELSKSASDAADVLITYSDGSQKLVINSGLATEVDPNEVTLPAGITLNDMVAEVVSLRFSYNPNCELKKEGGSWVLRPVGCTLH